MHVAPTRHGHLGPASAFATRSLCQLMIHRQKALQRVVDATFFCASA